MRRRIEVKVIEPADRDYFYLRWKDDRNGRRRTESTKILQTRGDRGRAAAERMAAEKEIELKSPPNPRAGMGGVQGTPRGSGPSRPDAQQPDQLYDDIQLC